MYGEASLIKSIVIPRLSHPTKRVEAWLTEMEQSKDENGEPLIVRYVVGKTLYLYCPGFQRQQPGLRCDRESSNIPPPSFLQVAGKVREFGGSDAVKMSAEVKVKLSEGEDKRNAAPESFAEYLATLSSKYPFLDVPQEWQACQLWWSEGKRKMKRPKSALANWLKMAETKRLERAPKATGTVIGRDIPRL